DVLARLMGRSPYGDRPLGAGTRFIPLLPLRRARAPLRHPRHRDQYADRVIRDRLPWRSPTCRPLPAHPVRLHGVDAGGGAQRQRLAPVRLLGADRLHLLFPDRLRSRTVGSASLSDAGITCDCWRWPRPAGGGGADLADGRYDVTFGVARER